MRGRWRRLSAPPAADTPTPAASAASVATPAKYAMARATGATTANSNETVHQVKNGHNTRYRRSGPGVAQALRTRTKLSTNAAVSTAGTTIIGQAGVTSRASAATSGTCRPTASPTTSRTRRSRRLMGCGRAGRLDGTR